MVDVAEVIWTRGKPSENYFIAQSSPTSHHPFAPKICCTYRFIMAGSGWRSRRRSMDRIANLTHICSPMCPNTSLTPEDLFSTPLVIIPNACMFMRFAYPSALYASCCLPPTSAPESTVSRCADGYTPAHPAPPPPPRRRRTPASRRTASCCRRLQRTKSRSACSWRSRASASCSAARKRLAPAKRDGFCGTAASRASLAVRPCGRRGLGAGGDKGENRQFNAVVVHLREPFGVDVE